MNRLTTNRPTSNLQALLNFTRAIDGRVTLAFAGGINNIDLCEYIANQAAAAEFDCAVTATDVLEGACFGCDCICAYLNVAAIQAAELHARLKDIEDILGDDYDLDKLRQIIAEASGQ